MMRHIGDAPAWTGEPGPDDREEPMDQETCWCCKGRGYIEQVVFGDPGVINSTCFACNGSGELREEMER